MSRWLEFVELIITCGTYKVSDSMPCIVRPAMLLFYSAVLPHKRKCIKHSTIRWLTFRQSKDYCLVLIVECLFAKASTANAGAELLKLRPRLREHQLICIKATDSNTGRFGSFPKSANFKMLYKIICWVFWAKTSHTHSGDIRDLCYILWKGA